MHAIIVTRIPHTQSFNSWIRFPDATGRAESYVLEFCKEVHEGSLCPHQSVDACLKWNLNKTNIARMHRHGQWHGDWGKGTPQLNWVIGIRRAESNCAQQAQE